MQGETAEEKIKDYKAKIRQAYKKAYKGLSQVEQELKSEYEMMANFSGDVLFSGDMTALTKMLGGMKAKQRNAVIDFFADLFRYLKEKLKGNQKITLEIVKLERLFNEAVYDAAQSLKNETETSENQKTTTEKISGSGDYLVSSIDFADVKYTDVSQISKKSLEENVKEIMNMEDDIANQRKTNGEYIKVLPETPKIILDNVQDAVNREIIIRFDALYLAVRNSGALQGNYHNYGEDFSNKLLSVLNNPNAIVRLKNGRINLFGTIINSQGNDSIVSIELNDVKNIDGKFNKYNLVVTMTPAKPNYINNLLKNTATKIEYEKEDLPQVNPQLHKSLSIINGKSSNNSIPLNGETVNNNLSGEAGDYSMNLRDNALDLLEGNISLDEYVEKQEKMNKARESRIRRAVKSERDKFKGFSGSIIDLERGVKEILGIADSRYDKETLKNEIGALLSLADRKNINQDTVSTIRAACEQMAEQIVEQSKNWHIRSEDSQEMLDEIRGKKIY